MKLLIFLILSCFAVFLTLFLMAKLIPLNSTGLTDSEIEDIWLSKNAIAVERSYFIPQSDAIVTNCHIPYYPLAVSISELKHSSVEYTPVSLGLSLCKINKELCESDL